MLCLNEVLSSLSDISLVMVLVVIQGLVKLTEPFAELLTLYL